MRLKRGWASVLGQKLHYLFVPSLSARKFPPIVLVCGLGVSSSYMIPAAHELARRSDVYCPDLPGFGKSSKAVRALDVSELAAYLSGFMEEGGIERAVVAGHSFGCQIAAEFAVRRPEKIERLVLAAPSGNPCANSLLRYAGNLALDALREPISMTPIAVRDYLAAGPARFLRTFEFSIQDRMEDKLPLIDKPALVIRGSKDPVVSAEWSERVARLLPNAELATIDKAAHALNYSRPAEFAALVRDFLQTQDS